jgi:hypothetical protein
MAQQMLSAAPIDLLRERIYVALVDDELCATVTLRPQTHRFRWDVLSLAAGSPHLDADDDVTTELWSALLEYAISCAGASGAKRLFATTADGSVGMRSLRNAGFEAYARFTVLERLGAPGRIESDCRPRRQEPSDVWSIHHLYHQTTPRVVQFAEALTSTVWELPSERLLARLVPRRHDVHALVLETAGGIEGYCRIETGPAGAFVSLIINPHVRHYAAPLVAAAIERSGIGPSTRIEIAIPEYASELVWSMENAGFTQAGERVAMVRHTTAPAIIYGRLAPVPSEVAERAPRGIPSYCRVGDGRVAATDNQRNARIRWEHMPS